MVKPAGNRPSTCASPQVRADRPRRYGAKESRPIPVWNGILEARHRKGIGPAIWVYLWCLDRITIEVNGVGWLLGRAPIKIERIAEELEEDYRSIRRCLERLDKHGYITRIRTPYGFTIGV